ncbi:hypothetical protein [Bacillus gaemokensis]|uniref:Group-specific protein n=1 Tax=Bacillus gaemokensis TaxID=574375 RepID=A0A073K6V1_9BACI|nr:hypothetical protein [Bacillus gaemokensis]KEK22989.1 hypothetical protein BAGA_15055 [Bacillus gaemokensis]KYG37457.1 hypothetical protein AZF08_23585 [Bacillus gaemokensis]
MKRKITFLLAFICFALPLQASAYTFQDLPVASKSKQWYIEIDKSHSTNPNTLQPKQGVFDTYSLFVKNIGKDVDNVSVEVHHNNPTSEAAFKPSSKSNMSSSKSHSSFEHMIFPLYVNTNTFEVVITWEEKEFSYNGHPESEGKKLTQTFVFNEQ